MPGLEDLMRGYQSPYAPPPAKSPPPGGSVPQNNPIADIMKGYGEAKPAEPPPITPPAVTAGRTAGILPDPEKNEETPDAQFWPDLLKQGVLSAVTAGREVEAGAKVATPSALGGSTFAEQAPKTPEEPYVSPEIKRLAEQDPFQGFTNPRWWAVQGVKNVGGAMPVMGAGMLGAAAGTMAAGPPGAMAGGAAGAALAMGFQAAVPAYKRAIAAGLDQDAAVDQALKVSGLSAAFGAVMGLVGGHPITGVAVDGALKRPVGEALLKAGVVEPALGLGQMQATKALETGQLLTPSELLSGYISYGTFGAGMHGITALDQKIIGRASVGGRIATPEARAKAWEALFGPPPEPPGSAPFWPQDHDYYLAMTKAIERRPESSLEPHEWLTEMKNGHAMGQNVELPYYLADANGKVSKGDLLAFLNARAATERPHEVVGGPAGGPEFVSKFDDSSGVQFGELWYSVGHDRDGKTTFFLHEVPKIIPSQYMRGTEYDVLAQKAMELAVAHRADRLTWFNPKTEPAFMQALNKWSTLHGMNPGMTRVHGFWDDTPYWEVNPAAASNIRQGGTLWSEGPGTRLVNDPFREGREAISSFLDRAQDGSGPRNTWIETPEGGQGMYLRLSRQPTGHFVDVANVDFEKRSSGAFTHYLDHIEREVKRRDLQGVRVENIFNDRLIPFLEGRGYSQESMFGLAGGPPSMRVERGVEYAEGRPAPPSWREVRPPARSEEMAAPGTYPGGGAYPVAAPHMLTPDELRPAGNRILKIMEDLRKRLGMKVPVVINLHDVPHPSRSFGFAGRGPTGYEIHLYLPEHGESGVEGLMSTAAHEFGHVVMFHFFDRAPMATKQWILQAYDDYRALSGPNDTKNAILLRRNNAVAQHYGEQTTHPDQSLNSLTPERRRYWTGFEEWFAENVARNILTNEKIGGVIDQHFQALGRRIVQVQTTFRNAVESMAARTPNRRAQVNRLVLHPSEQIASWMDSHLTDAAPWAADIFAAAQLQSVRAAREALNSNAEPYAPAVPQTASTGGARGLLAAIFGRGSSMGQAHAAMADKFNVIYKYMTSLPQLAKANPGLVRLQRYNEYMGLAHAEKGTLAESASPTLKAWVALQPKQADAVAQLINEYAGMTYRSVQEKAQSVSRMPSQAEFNDLVNRAGVNDRGLNVFSMIMKDFSKSLDRYQALLNQHVNRAFANDPNAPVVIAQHMQDIAQGIEKARKIPYFPFMRFGPYTLTIKDAAGKNAFFGTFESQRALRAAEAKARKDPKWQSHHIRVGELAKDVAPMVGLPPGLLDLIEQKLNLSPTQKAAMQDLKYEYLPAQSWAQQLREKDYTPGYSQNFIRAYAHYMFHSANYFTRMKYIDVLRDQINGLRAENRSMTDALKRDQIANFMSDHLDNWMNPKTDHAALRSWAFHWNLGWNPAAATLNLTQTVFGTYPYLAAKFGNDPMVLARMLNASRKLSTFYTKDTLRETTDPELKGIGEAVRQGIISETQANVLAAIADGRVLLQGFGGNRAEKLWNLYSRGSSFFFEMSEQFNRRVAFRTGWDMAMSDPGNPHVEQMVRENQVMYDGLRLKGFTDQEARAFVVGKDAVNSTQYVYAPYARPRMFRGKFGSLWVFHSFTQNTLMYMWNNKPAALRTLILMGAAGGLMGLPFAEDINGMLRVLAYKLFGKDFDLEDQVRQMVVDHLKGGGTVERPGDITTSEGGVRPDIYLHGLSRVGYGIPQILDYLGERAGVGHVPFPVIDRHRNIGMGNILPFEPGPLLAPQITGPGAGAQNLDSAAIREVERASGAIYGFGFAFWKALESPPTIGRQGMIDWKRWESIMPALVRNSSQAWRFYSEGKARSGSGAAIVKFDPTEPEQMMEIIGKALGYNPERYMAALDRRTAEREAEAFWDVRRQFLMQSAWSALQSGDKDVYSSVMDSVRDFNKMLPDEARGKAITAQALTSSFQSRAKSTARTEAGIPLQRGNIPLSRTIQRLYPEARAPNESR